MANGELSKDTNKVSSKELTENSSKIPLPFVADHKGS